MLSRTEPSTGKVLILAVEQAASTPFGDSANRFQLRDRFEILRAASGALCTDQSIQVQDATAKSEQFHLDGGIKQLTVCSSSGNLGKEVQPAHVSRQSKVQTRPERPNIQSEGKSGRGVAQIWIIGFQRGNNAFQIRRTPLVNDVYILRISSGSVSCGSYASDQNELDVTSDKRCKQFSESRHVIA
jgi:hypothetical protein